LDDLAHFALGKKDITLLDAGCGTGGMLQSVRSCWPEWELRGIDAAPEAVRHAQARGLSHIRQASVNSLPAEAESCDLVTCLYVLYHAQVDEKRLSVKCGGCSSLAGC
jgi:ubiquinone/menaquinone biosynthesis C-methylase UbiE